MAQITVQLWEKQFKRFSELAEAACLRRDAYFARLLQRELPHIRTELRGQKNSEAARRLIESRVAEQPRTKLTLALPDDVMKMLRDACDAHVLVRDALLNRLLFFLTATPEAVVQIFSMSPATLDWIAGDLVGNASLDTSWLSAARLRTSPALQVAGDILADPLDVYREMLRALKDESLALPDNQPADWAEVSLHRLEFAIGYGAVRFPALVGLSLVLSDRYVPGTAAYDAARAEGDAFLKQLMGSTPTKTRGRKS